MASIDYREARKEIIKAFRAQTGGGRKILFWYDAPAIFKEDITADNLDCCRVLVCEKNEFSIKKTIEALEETIKTKDEMIALLKSSLPSK